MSVRDVFLPLVVPFVVLDCIVVGLRLSTRIAIRSTGYDDFAMVFALIGFLIFSAMLLKSVHYGIGAEDEQPYYNAVLAAKFFTIIQIVYALTSGLCKLAVSLVLFRLTTGSDMRAIRVILVAIIIINIVFSLVLAFVFALQCRPLSLAWGGTTEGSCMSTSFIGRAGLATSIEDVIVSWICATLPIYMLWKTNIPVKVKAVIIVLLGFGAVSSIATIVRLKYVIIVQDQTDSQGLSNSVQVSLTATIYSFLELALSIFAASLAALRPILRKIAFFSDISSGSHGKKKTSDGSYQLHTIGQITSGHRKGNGAITLNDSDQYLDGDSQRGIITTHPWPKDVEDSGPSKMDTQSH